MPNAFLIVGVGGCGRGVCNHLKYEIEQEFGSLQLARTMILVIDGPDRDEVYSLPGGFQIDTSQNSPEFYRTTVSPANAIRNIARKVDTRETVADPGERYIGEWLSQADARLIPTEAMDPTTGFGGHRTPGHAFFYLDVSNIQNRLQQVYNQSRTLLGGGSATGSQVIVIVVGSQSGGTGAGLFFDILHTMRDLTSINKDMVLCFVPLPNTYHFMITSAGGKQRLNAQNFAGILNLIRFMSVKGDFPSIIKYSDNITVRNNHVADVPFLIDGDVNYAKLNDAPPRLGVVPAIADFVLTIVKDNLLTAALQPRITDWAASMIGIADAQEKYAGFGISSIRYAYKEILKTFSYRFAVALYDQILTPSGSALSQGEMAARGVLNSMMFTQMIENPSEKTTPLEPPTPPNPNPAFKVLATNVRTGHPSDAPFVYPRIKLIEVIPHSGTFIGKEPIKVKNDAEKKMQELREQTESWLFRQKTNIVSKFLLNMEEVIWETFYVVRDGKKEPRTLQDSPTSIVIARDFLDYVLQRLNAFKNYTEKLYTINLFPEGPQKPNIIAAHLGRLKDVERRLTQKKDTQEAYLSEAQRHLDLEIWDMLVKGIIFITEDMITRVNTLWDLIGESANGWVHLLNLYREEMGKKYYGEVARRREFDKLRLRKYVPETAGAAEDRLFEVVAIPVLNALKINMFWTFAVNPERPNGYELLLNSPVVKNYDDSQAINDLRDVITGQRLRDVHYYNPLKHCQYAINELDGPLSAKSLWDILDLECWEGWCKNEKIPPNDRNERFFVSKIANEFTVRSGVTLNYTAAHNLVGQDYTFCMMPGDPKSIGGKIMAELENKGMNIFPHVDFAKELRRVSIHFRVPIKQWAYYSTAEMDYLKYIDNKSPQILINVYKQEQIASKIRRLIEDTIDSNFTQVIEPLVTASLYSYEVFRLFSLCYIMDLIPKKDGADISSPRIFYLGFATGDVNLAEEWDIYTLLYNVNTPERLLKDQWRTNTEIQKNFAEHWENKKSQYKPGTLKTLLNELEKRVKTLKFPAQPVGKVDVLGDIGREHLSKAMQAVAIEYIQLARANLP